MKQPHILVEEGAVNGTVLLPGDPGRVDLIAEHLDDVEHLSDNREYRLVNGTYDGTPLTVCSTGVGCPSAAVAVEELAEVGAERLVRVGTTGGLQAGSPYPATSSSQPRRRSSTERRRGTKA